MSPVGRLDPEDAARSRKNAARASKVSSARSSTPWKSSGGYDQTPRYCACASPWRDPEGYCSTCGKTLDPVRAFGA